MLIIIYVIHFKYNFQNKFNIFLLCSLYKQNNIPTEISQPYPQI